MKTLQQLQQHYVDCCARYGQNLSDKPIIEKEVHEAREALRIEMEKSNED